MRSVIALIAVIGLASCAGVTDVVATGPDTYIVASHGTMGWSSSGAQKAKAFQDAEKFCGEKGQRVEAINTRQVDGGFGKIASAELEFRCVPK